jgi:ribose 5-phosphate isomerase A
MTSGRASMLEAERVARAHASSGEPLVTDSGNGILDCDFGRIAEPARLDKRIWRIVGVVESGLFISRVLRGRCGRRPPLRQRARPSGQSADPGAHGRVGVWQIDDRRRTLGAARLAVRGGRFTSSGIKRRKDARWNAAHGCRPFAVAGACRRLDRWAARQEATGHHHVLCAQTNLSPNHHRRPAGGAAGLSARRSRFDCRAFVWTPRSFHARSVATKPDRYARRTGSKRGSSDVDAGAPAAHVANEIIRLLGASATVVQGVSARRLT